MSTMESEIDFLIECAREGDREAMGLLVEQVKDSVYGLAMRMLAHPADAEDATQEILIRVITHLSDFRGDSSFSSWVYRIACNYLLTTRRRRAESREISFEFCEKHIEDGLAEASPSPGAEQGIIVQEMMILCTQAILLSLARELRMTYILGEVLGFESEQGAALLDISRAAFRKRLSRARAQIRDFMRKNCGLVNRNNRCRCASLVPHHVRINCLRPDRLRFSDHPRGNTHVGVEQKDLERMDEEDRVKALFRSHPDYIAPIILSDVFGSILGSVRAAIQGDQIQ